MVSIDFHIVLYIVVFLDIFPCSFNASHFEEGDYIASAAPLRVSALASLRKLGGRPQKASNRGNLLTITEILTQTSRNEFRNYFRWHRNWLKIIPCMALLVDCDTQPRSLGSFTRLTPSKKSVKKNPKVPFWRYDDLLYTHGCPFIVHSCVNCE